MTTAPCPLCHSDVIIEDDLYENDLVTCANCGDDLEIVSVTPLILRALEEGNESDEDEDSENENE